jgi:hypothetical protein
MNNLVTLRTTVGVIALMLSACSGKTTQDDVNKRTAAQKADAAQQPEFVRNTPDGQPIYRLKITEVPAECEGCTYPDKPHWVYYVGTVTTTNQKVSSGKVSRTEVVVLINGAPVELADAKKQIDVALAAKLREQAKQLEEQ